MVRREWLGRFLRRGLRRKPSFWPPGQVDGGPAWFDVLGRDDPRRVTTSVGALMGGVFSGLGSMVSGAGSTIGTAATTAAPALPMTAEP
jgi:hypothetical protein